MTKIRYSELDWLRVILVLLVFLHHVLMPFNGDNWHIMNKDSSKLLDDIMVYFEQLRLNTLFFIAGAGSYLLLCKISKRDFLINKFNRLFMPVIIGMILIIPPQHYFEHINDYANLAAAYQKRMFSFEANHLWFIEFLIIFMVFALPLYSLLNTGKGKNVINKLEIVAVKKHGLFSMVLVLILLRCSLKLLMPSESHAFENLSVSMFYLFFFICGMCFIKSSTIWQAIADNRKLHLKYFIISSILFYSYYYSPDLSAYLSLQIRWQLWWFVCSLVSWSGLLVLLGYAAVFCKNTPKWLITTNELIYPFYILHQTIIVAFAFYIVQCELSIIAKALILLSSTLILCMLLCYFVIKPFNVFRYLFGLKVNGSRSG